MPSYDPVRQREYNRRWFLKNKNYKCKWRENNEARELYNVVKSRAKLYGFYNVCKSVWSDDVVKQFRGRGPR